MRSQKSFQMLPYPEPALKVTAAIPARLESTRLPRKLLLDLGGKPLLRRTWENVQRMRLATEVVVLTDSEEIREAVKSWGGRVLMTPASCNCGTERIVSVLPELKGDLILNVQGDEPFIDTHLLDALVEAAEKQVFDVITPVYCLSSTDVLEDASRVKVVLGNQNEALYFSRSPIPFVRGLPREQWLKNHTFWGHIGVYGYRRQTLERYSALTNTPLEAAESLEQLRFLANGLRVQTLETQYHSVTVDTAADLERAKQYLISHGA